MNVYTYQLVMLHDSERSQLAYQAGETLHAAFGVPFRIEPATTVRDVFATHFGFSQDCRLTPAQRGCALGHRRIQQSFVASCQGNDRKVVFDLENSRSFQDIVDLKVALVLEDDIVIQNLEGLKEIVRQFWRSFGQSEQAPASVVQLEERNRPWEPTIPVKGIPSPGHPFVPYVGPRWGTVAYLMNLPAAKILVDRPLDAVADAWPKEGIDYYAPPKGANIITTDHCQSHIKSGNWDRVTITPAEKQ